MQRADPLQCGPFELVRPLARGGMAQVWEARHGTTPIAVKFVSLEGELALAFFADEARAHARLVHPHILQLLDMGQLESEGVPGVTPGTPWLALEFISGGDLSACIDELRWPEVFVVLSAILDALAHAHAKGIIHRDLKPANVLLAAAEDARPGVKLCDFGIAHIQGRSDTELTAEVVGTATCLAPEQCRGAFRELGPWTDLYGLGCVAFRMVHGSYPFPGTRGVAAFKAHLKTQPPRLEARWPVPDGLADWVARLLQKRPGDRYSSAAEAMKALWELGPAPGEPSSSALRASRTPMVTLMASRWPVRGTGTRTPTGWRRPGEPRLSRPLVDAGLGLFALRSRAPVGHVDLRDRLWSELTATRTAGSPRAVVLQGPSGAGVSHLGEWITSLAMQEGVAQGFRILALAGDAPDQALIRALREILRVEGLQSDSLLQGIKNNLALWAADPTRLAPILFQLLGEGLGTHAVRRGALRRLIADRCRPAAVVWIDDAHLCADAIRFVQSTLRNLTDLPILFVLGSHEPLALSPDLPVCTLEVGPLTPQAFRRLCTSILPLAQRLQQSLQQHSQRLGGEAVLLLESLARRGVLQSAQTGYFSKVDLPQNVAETGAFGFDTESLPDRQVHALTRAAVFRSEVDTDVWATACDDPRGGLSRNKLALASGLARHHLLERLKREGLVEATPQGWHFMQRAFRTAVLQWAEDRDALQGAHSDVADALRLHKAPLGQLARHLAAAGRKAPALESYLSAVGYGPNRRGGGVPVDILIEEGLALMDELEIPSGDPRRGMMYTQRATRSSQDPDAEGMLREVLAKAVRHGWPLTEAVCISVLSKYDPDPNMDIEHALDALARGAGEVVEVEEACCRIAIGVMLQHKRRYEEALAVLEPVVRLSGDARREQLRRKGLANQAELMRVLDRPFELEHCQQQARASASYGDYSAAMIWWVDAGESARSQGDLDSSDQANLEALALAPYTLLPSTAPLLNLAINAFKRQQTQHMRSFLDRAVRESQGALFDEGFAVLELCWATLGSDRSIWRDRLETADACLKHEILPGSVELLEAAAERLEGPDSVLANRIREISRR